MYWLPTYLRILGASSFGMGLSAIPYIFSSTFGIGELCFMSLRNFLVKNNLNFKLISTD